MNNRNISISISRIIATLMILICHVIKYYSFIPGNKVLGQFFNVGVPAFVILSGYLYGSKYSETGRWDKSDIFRFYLNRILRVALPCQIWALFILMVGWNDIINSGVVLLNLQGLNHIIIFSDFPNGGVYISQTWFVTLILLCYAFIPFLYKVARRFSIKKCVCIWIFIQLFCFMGLNLGFFYLFVLCYCLGYKKEGFEKIKFVHCIIGFCTAVIIRLVAKKWWDDSILYNNIIVGSTHFVIAGNILLSIRLFFNHHQAAGNRIMENMVVKYIEKHSYSIYLVHYAIIPFAYEKHNLVVATIIFMLWTILCSFVLDFVSGKVISLIKKYRKV